MIFLSNNEGGTYNDSSLEYFGTYVGVLSNLMDDSYDYLSVRISDYADWDLTKKYINEMFPDFI